LSLVKFGGFYTLKILFLSWLLLQTTLENIYILKKYVKALPAHLCRFWSTRVMTGRPDPGRPGARLVDQTSARNESWHWRGGFLVDQGSVWSTRQASRLGAGFGFNGF
jgi:hypothetical protein